MNLRKKAKTKVSKALPETTTSKAPEFGGEVAEQQRTSEKSTTGFPVVGIGASAGGLAAFQAFFSGIPANTKPGMAFVLVQHLAPDHESILTDLIQRYTHLQVCEVEDGMAVKPNRVYIIPPKHDMAFLNGKLQLLIPSAPRGQRLPIDFFFQSLAQDQGERAICIVLSGTGSDGTQGARSIKAEGGMVMVQHPDSAEYDGMPRSAIATGLADYELLPAEMPAQLTAYVAHIFGTLSPPAVSSPPQIENALQKIFVLLRAQTGRDFSQYKPSTIQRRVQRRLAVNQIETLDAYVKYLQQTPAEAEALLRDLLIGVTSFFRDPAAFKVLEEQVISKLFNGETRPEAIRVWSIGCSTGEEAYSIAILLQELLLAKKQNCKVQIFATDIDRQAIATARAGLYPASIAADLSPERLDRFFTLEPEGHAYRINKNIRDMLIFSEQDVIKDPPFSKLNLICCRNILIYMGKDLQKKLMPLFHYALIPAGFLFLGTSETVGEFGDLFTTLDRKMKLYQRKENFQSTKRTAFRHFLPSMATMDRDHPLLTGKTAVPGKLSLRELTERVLLQEVAPTGALVNGHGDILYLHGRTGMYLEPTPGAAGVNNILKMAREGLRHELACALHKAVGAKEIVRCSGLRVKTNGDFTAVNLTIRPVVLGPIAVDESPLFLVILEEITAVDPEQALPAEGAGQNGNASAVLNANVDISSLRQELRSKEEYLLAANEELETSNEEMKSSNEEMQSMNEELQSTNEELETSREEMQSINEELATINTELQSKVADLSRANSDMNNLLAGTGIATVFVDLELHILRFTPTATEIINLIKNDVGRPVGHIVSNLVGYDRLVTDVQSVLNTLIPCVVEVQTTNGKWYTLRILPYRTLDNVIEGAVITFTDITEIKQLQEVLRKTSALNSLAAAVHDNQDAMTVQDLQGNILAWNPAAERMYGWSESESRTMNIRELVPEKLREESLVKLEQLSRDGTLKSFRTQRIAKDGTVVEITMTATTLLNQSGQIYAIATTERGKRLKSNRLT